MESRGDKKILKFHKSHMFGFFFMSTISMLWEIKFRAKPVTLHYLPLSFRAYTALSFVLFRFMVCSLGKQRIEVHDTGKFCIIKL